MAAHASEWLGGEVECAIHTSATLQFERPGGESMALFAVLIYASDSAHEPGQSAQTSEDIATCDAHADELASSAAMTAAWAFTPRSMARSVRATGVTEGPFIDGPDLVAGVYFLEAPDLESALASAASNPVVLQGGGVEVRPVHSGGPVSTDAS
ncbi:YciI family protein [Intrasporangium sp. DVR]|uniref:YciI family protein n=1 Tax=Intrasporangium sp. DVR TaxID=3127867 RepID=UPI003341097F